MAQANLADYKNIYLQTAKEYIGKMLDSLDKLSKNALDKEALNDLHLASHSLKGQSQVMGFKNIANLCINIEKNVSDILNGISKFNNVFIALFKKTIDELDRELSKVEKTQ